MWCQRAQPFLTSHTTGPSEDGLQMKWVKGKKVALQNHYYNMLCTVVTTHALWKPKSKIPLLNIHGHSAEWGLTHLKILRNMHSQDWTYAFENKGWLRSVTMEDGCCSHLALKKDVNMEIVYEFCILLSSPRIGRKWKTREQKAGWLQWW